MGLLQACMAQDTSSDTNECSHESCHSDTTQSTRRCVWTSCWAGHWSHVVLSHVSVDRKRQTVLSGHL